jgi:hypothetical protein
MYAAQPFQVAISAAALFGEAVLAGLEDVQFGRRLGFDPGRSNPAFRLPGRPTPRR